MYAPALRIWSLANLLMLFLQLLLSILTASMSGAFAAAAVAVAAAANGPIATATTTTTTNQSDTNHSHIQHIAVDALRAVLSHRDGEAGAGRSSVSSHRPARSMRLRSRRHTTRWHSRANIAPAPAPAPAFTQTPAHQQHINPNTSTATAADQNWWRLPAAQAPVRGTTTTQLHANSPPSPFAIDGGKTAGAATAQTLATLQQQQQQHHVTRHHHHQDYHLHMPPQSPAQSVDQQHQQQQQLQQHQRQHLFSSSAPFEHRTPTSTSTSLPPAALMSLQSVQSATSAPASPSIAATSATTAAVQPAFYAGNIIAGRRQHHNRHNVHPQPQQQQQQFHETTAVGSHQRSASGAAGPSSSSSSSSRRRFCSARDVATLAYEAPTVFEGKVKSMSADRRRNFSVTFEVLHTHKEQPQLKLPQLVRLQFEQRNTSGECDIYREQLRPRGFVRDLEQGRVYLLFVEQQRGDIGNFSILGRPVRRSAKAISAVQMGVQATYGERAKIDSLSAQNLGPGRRVRIVCKVSGQPPPKVTWFKDGHSIGRNRSKYQFVYLRRRSELIIQSAQHNDSGQYECRAKNKVTRPTVSQFVWVDVPREKRNGTPCPHNAFCLNGGTCLFFAEVGETACKCLDDYTGQRCETKTPTNRQSSCGDEHHDCSPPASSGSGSYKRLNDRELEWNRETIM